MANRTRWSSSERSLCAPHGHALMSSCGGSLRNHISCTLAKEFPRLAKFGRDRLHWSAAPLGSTIPGMRFLRLLALVALLAAVPAATATAVARMPIGFFDDPSFRWSPAAGANLAAAEAAHASVIRALVDWASVAPTRPAHPLDGNDPAYRLSDLDALVETAQRYDLQVLITISGTPAWANGGESQNHPPTNLNDLTQFAHMLAARYNGSRAGAGVVTLFSVWNEPNLEPVPDSPVQGRQDREPGRVREAVHGRLHGDQGGRPERRRGRRRDLQPGPRHADRRPGFDSVAPATFAELVAKTDPKLPFVAWATHPYPSDFEFGPTQKVVFPDVGFSTMTEFGESLQKWFGRRVPIWVTEYGEMTKPESLLGVSYAQQAADARKALELAEANPYVQMFIWFILRDSSAATWFSGLEQPSGKKKPAYSAFASTAAGIVGQPQTIAPGHPFKVTLAVPFIAWHDPAGSPLGVNYVMKHGSSTVASASRGSRSPVTTRSPSRSASSRPRTRPTRSRSRSKTSTASPSRTRSHSSRTRRDPRDEPSSGQDGSASRE